jgi:hypothetical protein
MQNVKYYPPRYYFDLVGSEITKFTRIPDFKLRNEPLPYSLRSGAGLHPRTHRAWNNRDGGRMPFLLWNFCPDTTGFYTIANLVKSV